MLLNKFDRKKNYILIHGAWHAKWCWKYIKPLLAAHGHNIIDLDLPGHGNNFEDFKHINLQAYVEYVINIVKIKNINSVILVGHSMAGVIISQVAEYIPELIERLVYVAAFIPGNGSSLILEARKSSTLGISPETKINENNSEITLIKSSKLRDLLFNCCSEEDVKFAIESLQSQPVKPFFDSITISTEKFGSVKKTYIECLNDKTITPADQQRMYAHINCEIISINADHSPFFSAKEDLTKILLNC